MTIQFNYDKKQVLQALRYHFINRIEIRTMIIVVNVFALSSAALFYFQKITPLAFLVGSFLWFALMITFWFVLPGAVYKRAETFRDHFSMSFKNDHFTLGNERGERSWQWTEVSKYVESPNFFHLYFDSRSFFLVPKYAFANTDEVYELRQILKQNIKKR